MATSILIRHLQSIDWENMSYLDRLIHFSKWLDKAKKCPIDNLPLKITGTYIPGVYGAWGRWYECPKHQLILRLNWDAPYLLPELNELLKKLTNQQYSFSGVEDLGIKETLPLKMAKRPLGKRKIPMLKKPKPLVVEASKTLRKGDTGTSVSLLKHKLSMMGFPPVTTSLYDELTEVMVKKAQASLKLPITGIADPVTISRINQAFQQTLQKIVNINKKPTTLWEMWARRKGRPPVGRLQVQIGKSRRNRRDRYNA